MSRPREGGTRTFERTFTVEDVQRFADLSGDDQPRHAEPDEDERVMGQGSLTATLPTKPVSDSEVLASTTEFDFHRPVYTGERIACRSTGESVAERDDRYEFTTDVVCENDDGETVLTSTTDGIIWKEG